MSAFVFNNRKGLWCFRFNWQSRLSRVRSRGRMYRAFADEACQVLSVSAVDTSASFCRRSCHCNGCHCGRNCPRVYLYIADAYIFVYRACRLILADFSWVWDHVCCCQSIQQHKLSATSTSQSIRTILPRVFLKNEFHCFWRVYVTKWRRTKSSLKLWAVCANVVKCRFSQLIARKR